MELPLPSLSPLISSSFSSSSSSSSSVSTASMKNSMNISNASLLVCGEQSARSYTNPITSDASNQHQYQCIQVYDEQVRSKKRKLASSLQEEACVSTINSMYLPQGKMDDQYCHSDNQELITIKDDQILYEEGGNGCTTPPHDVQCRCNAAHEHYCSRREVNDKEEQINEDLAVGHAQQSASIVGDNGGYKGELLHNGDGCGYCSMIRRGPPPAPRKPKAKPRNILKSNHLINFFIPPDLELLFFSTSSSTSDHIYKQANHDA